MSEHEEPGPGQGGGVKAMLSRIKEQFRDSHVQLPDGTVPKGKLNIGKRTVQPKESASTVPAAAEKGKSEAGPQGVKAKLAELNSKFSGSFVQLPDGTVPKSFSTPKKADVKAGRQEKQDYTPVQEIQTTPQSKKSEANNIYSDYPPRKGSSAVDDGHTRVYSDYETVTVYSQEPAVDRTVGSKDTENGYVKTPSKTSHVPAYESAYGNAVAATSSAGFNPPPALLDKNKGTKPANQSVPDDAGRPLISSGHYISENKSAEKHLIVAAAQVQQATAAIGSRVQTYGIGVSFKPDEKGYLEVVKLIPGGPGAKNGRILVGDKLRRIDDIDITQLPLEEFPALISGPIGSSVKLSLNRHRDGDGDVLVHVTLTRGPCESSNGSGPRVLVPKVIAVNPVHLINTDPSPATDGGGTSHIYSNGATLSQHGPAETTRLSPNHSVGAKANLFAQEETARVGQGSTPGISRVSTLSSESRSQLHERASSAQSRPSITPSALNYATAPSSYAISGSSVASLYASKRVGVGIVFLNDEWGGLQVKRLAEGGPAHLSGAIYQGDTLVEINGRDVRGRSVSDIQDEIVGPWNSTVVLGFRRHRPGQPDSLHRVQLARIWDPPQPDIPSRPQAPAKSEDYVRPAKILEMLFLGDDSVSRNREVLRSEGITCIINAAKECPCHFEREFAYTHMQFDDVPSENIRKGFDQVSAIISRNMLQGLSSLVHCSSGFGRSAALCIAFLMKEKKATLRQAFHLIKRAKPSMNLNYGFYLQLVDYERDLFGFNTLNAMTQEDYVQILLGTP